MATSRSPAVPQVFVIQDSLRPGDVILTRGAGKFSDGIASATGSRFSHAILVVEPCSWFEADDDGVGFSDPLTCGRWHDGPGIHEWVTPLPDCADAEAFRHPALRGRDLKETQGAIEKIVRPWAGTDYSDYRRLVHPLAVAGRPSWLISVGLAITQFLDPREPEGMFCSEVVARVFEALVRDHGFADTGLFRAPRRAELVAPGHLADSLLIRVDGAVIHRDRLPRDHRIGEGQDADRRSPTKLARSSRNIQKLQMEFDKAVAARISEAGRTVEAEHANVECQLNDAIALAQKLGAARASEHLRTLSEAMKALVHREEAQRANHAGDFEERYRILVAWHELEFAIHDAVTQAQEETVALLESQGRTDRIEELRAVLDDARAKIRKGREERKRALEQVRRQHSLPPG